MRRVAWVTVLVVGVLVFLSCALVFVLTNTDFGRERVRRIAVSVLNKAAHGHVSIGRIDGNLLRGIVAGDVTITDSTGAPFVAVRQASARYSLRDLFHKRLAFRGVRIDHPVVVLDEYAPKHWNFDRIFPHSPSTSAPKPPGFGSWLAATDVRVTDGRFILRRWMTDSGTGRDVIVRVPGGYQQIISADSITATVPVLRIEDPAAPVRFAQVASLRTNFALFTPPVARIMDLSAAVYLDGDSIWFSGARVALPDSRIVDGTGRYAFEEPALSVTARAERVAEPSSVRPGAALGIGRNSQESGAINAKDAKNAKEEKRGIKRKR